MTIKALEQETILDKIRAEIWDLQYGDEEKSMTDEDRADAYNNAIRQVIEIIDRAIKALEQESTTKSVTIKQLEEMYIKFEDKLWMESEDVRGDEMIEVDYAEQILQNLLAEFGCWDGEDKNE